MTVYADEKITAVRMVRCDVHGLSVRAHFGKCPRIIEATSYDSKRCGRPIRWVMVAEEGNEQSP